MGSPGRRGRPASAGRSCSAASPSWSRSWPHCSSAAAAASKGNAKGGTASTTPATQATTPATPVAQINLLPPAGGKAVGLARVFAQGNRRLLIVAGQGLAPGTYALWLYTSQAKSRLLGFVPSRIGTNGRFVTQGAVPDGAASYSDLVVTSEQISRTRPQIPTSPGTIVLKGKLQLG